jgi:hypothetical protein
MMRFFQSPTHYPDVDAVAEFVGNTEEGALRVLWDAHHERLAEAFPPDVSLSIEGGDFDHPEPPDYGGGLEGEEDEFDDQLDEEDASSDFGIDYGEVDEVDEVDEVEDAEGVDFDGFDFEDR